MLLQHLLSFKGAQDGCLGAEQPQQRCVPHLQPCTGSSEACSMRAQQLPSCRQAAWSKQVSSAAPQSA